MFLPSPLFLSLPLVALSSLLSLLFGCVCRARSPGDTGSSEMQPLSPNTSQIHGGERISGQTAKWMRQAGCCRAGEGGRWAGRQAALGSQARRALLSFRGAGFLQPGPTSEERSPRSELSEASGSSQPCQVPLLSWARAQAGAPPGPVCVCCPGSVSAGPPLALSAEDALRPCTEGGRPEGRQGGEPAGASTCSAWTWPAHRSARTQAPPSSPRDCSSFCARAGCGRAALSGGPSGRHGLLVLGPVVICGFLCRIPMEPGARQSAAFWRK